MVRPADGAASRAAKRAVCPMALTSARAATCWWWSTGHDADEAGDEAAAKLMAAYGAERLRPPVHKDWLDAWRAGYDLGELSHTLWAYLDPIPFGYFVLVCRESGQDFAPLPLRYPKVVEAAREFCHHLVKLLG